MKRRRIIFRADAGKSIGFGHFIRSLALAGYLKSDFECVFTTYNYEQRDLSVYQKNEIIKVCGIWKALEGENLNDANDNFLKDLSADDIVVLDNYYFSTDYQKKIKDKGCRLVCIDDMHDRHMVCDLLMTPSPLTRSDFSVESDTKFIGGIEYGFLREPFFSPNVVRPIRPEINEIVVSMGGADAFDLTEKVLSIIFDVFPYSNIHVIAGDTVSIPDDIVGKTVIHPRLSANEIVELFDNSDLGIFPASTICLEAFSRGLPVAVGYYVENQEAFYKYGENNRLFIPLGCFFDDSFKIKSRLELIKKNFHQIPAVSIDFFRNREKIVELFKSL